MNTYNMTGPIQQATDSCNGIQVHQKILNTWKTHDPSVDPRVPNTVESASATSRMDGDSHIELLPHAPVIACQDLLSQKEPTLVMRHKAGGSSSTHRDK